MYENILLPIDRGSKSNIKSAKEAIKLANAFDSTIYVLYVNVVNDKRINHDKREPINEIKSFFEQEKCNIDIKYDIKDGKPVNKICNYTTNNNIDLIVMTTTSRSWLGKITLGSVTDKTIQNTPCPVLTLTN